MNKKWLPPFYGTKSYSEMNQEEKDVIDEFQGREGYEKVFRRQDYYLADPCRVNMPLMLNA